MKTRTF